VTATAIAETVSPTTGRVLRRSAFWIAGAVFAVVIVAIGLLFTGATTPGLPLEAGNPAPGGAKALVEVLRDQGVEVEVVDSLDEARDAVDDPATTTLLFYDASNILDAGQLADVYGLAAGLVVIDPGFDQLDALTPDIAQGGSADDRLAADCSLPAATRAGTISGGGFGYRYTGDDPSAIVCFPSGDDVSSLVQVPTATGTATVVGTVDAFSNDVIDENGNAALALGLLGGEQRLVWYLPTVDDLTSGTPPTLGELSPGWVIPVTALVLLTALAAAVWRGRRFGPLVIENLPVTVRANETMQGRARLYEKGGARLHALDSLRIGTVERLARLCGLPRVATVDDVIAAVAELTGGDEAVVRRVLLDAVPGSDRELVRMSDDLLTLERAAAASIIS
jgi:hypothetical protein